MNVKQLLSLALLLPFISQIKAQCFAPSASTTISVNNLNVRMNVGGDMWWDLLSDAQYEFPKGSGINTFFAGGIWISGLTQGDSLRVAAMTYRQNGTDFYPGPLTDSGTVSQNTCVAFDRFFIMYQTDIDAFVNSGIINQSLYDWPGRANPHNNTPNSHLAPFVDVNSDGIYNPEDGDYPAIKGDMALWSVFNDVGGAHFESGSSPIGVEVHQMVYAYNSNSIVGNSLFYDYKLIKKSHGDLHSVYFGQFADPDLGNGLDDNIASSSTKQLGIVFNGDSIDENTGGYLGYGSTPPASAIKFLKTPLTDAGNATPMSSFVSFSNIQSQHNSTPYLTYHYYNYLRGKWVDGQDIVAAGNGRIAQNPNAPVHPYMFDVDAPQTWTECNAGNTAGDRSFLMSTGEFELKHKTPVELSLVSYSLFPRESSTNFTCDGLADVLVAADSLQQFYYDNPLIDTVSSDTTVGIFNPILNTLDVTIFPNPSKGSFALSYDSNKPVDIEIFDLSGRTILTQKEIRPSQKIQLEQEGIYILRIEQEELQTTKRLVIH